MLDNQIYKSLQPQDIYLSESGIRNFENSALLVWFLLHCSYHYDRHYDVVRRSLSPIINQVWVIEFRLGFAIFT